jgi:pimeloyl-ACP methyl ester carboxylesterase
MLHYKTYQHADPQRAWVTFIHGAGGSSSIWFRQVRDFKAHFNVLMVDLRGHGSSKQHSQNAKFPTYTFEDIANDVIEVLDELKVENSHFVGISLGTIIIKEIADLQPHRVLQMVLGGAIVKLNFRSQLLMKMGVIFKSVIPYILLYKLFAWIIMPRKKHKESRSLFVREARKLYQKEFIRWFKLAAEINHLLSSQRANLSDHGTLYIMGDEDHMFLPSIQKLVGIDKDNGSAKLAVIPACGHVVNVEKPADFNRIAIEYLRGH